MALIELDTYYPNDKQALFSEYDITNFDIITKKDEKVGSVASVLVDNQSNRIRYLVVDTGFWILGKKVLLPIALGQIVYMDRRVYVEGLTKEQVKALPEYNDRMAVDAEHEKQLKSVLRPLVAEVMTDRVDNPATYDMDREPYFYEIKDPHLKEIQKQLMARKSY